MRRLIQLVWPWLKTLDMKFNVLFCMHVFRILHKLANLGYYLIGDVKIFNVTILNSKLHCYLLQYKSYYMYLYAICAYTFAIGAFI